MTIKDAFKIYTTGLEKRSALEGKISDLLTKQADTAAAMQAAAESGDLDAYTKHRQAGQLIDDQLTVTRAQLAKLEKPLSEAEASAAWTDYQKTHNARIKKAWNLYAQRRAELAKEFLALFETEREPFQARQDLAQMIDPSIMNDPHNPRRLQATFPLSAIENKDVINDRDFFRRTGLISADDDFKIGKMIVSEIV